MMAFGRRSRKRRPHRGFNLKKQKQKSIRVYFTCIPPCTAMSAANSVSKSSQIHPKQAREGMKTIDSDDGRRRLNFAIILQSSRYVAFFKQMIQFPSYLQNFLHTVLMHACACARVCAHEFDCLLLLFLFLFVSARSYGTRSKIITTKHTYTKPYIEGKSESLRAILALDEREMQEIEEKR